MYWRSSLAVRVVGVWESAIATSSSSDALRDEADGECSEREDCLVVSETYGAGAACELAFKPATHCSR